MAPDWKPIATAPAETVLITYGPAGHRFGRRDALGQWRNMIGRPMNTSPTHWMPLPDPPHD